MAKILLVEDNELNRDMLSRRLVRGRVRGRLAEDGARGWRRHLREPPSSMMDMSLPVLDGWRRPRLKATRDEAIPSSRSRRTPCRPTGRAAEAGCDDYDTKPVELERLLGKIERLLRGASLHAAG